MNEQRNWEKFAVLLIDVQRDFWSEDVSAAFPDFPANVDRLLTLSRSEGLEIIHLRARFRPDMSDWMPRYRIEGRIPCVEGTEGAVTLPFAAEKPGENVIIKQTYDGFHHRDLLPYLNGKGKRFLLTAGLVTSVCVFLTTASAAQLGFLVAVVQDCCADVRHNHQHVMDRYRFLFDRTTTDGICGDHARWSALLRDLEASSHYGNT